MPPNSKADTSFLPGREPTPVAPVLHPQPIPPGPVLVVAGSAVECGGLNGRRLIPFGETLLIGRSDWPSRNFLSLDDPRVSRQHARLARVGGELRLTDFGSTNGTFVDGARVTESAALRDGSVIAIGPYVLVLRMSPPSALAAIEEDSAAPFAPVPTLSGETALLVRRLRVLAPAGLDLLLTGETGAGKEVFARAMHRLSGRRGRFVAINCAAIPATLVESELFGYARGAHSTATESKAGILEEAEAGTLFLDEIGDMPWAAQTKLLRFLEDRAFVPLGAVRPREIDVRVIAATGRPVPADAEAAAVGEKEGGLRLDLMARLGPAPIRIPSLRARLEDLGLLVRHFVDRAKPELRKPFAPEAFAALFGHDWPGNVRELEKVVAVALAISAGEPEVRLEHLPDWVGGKGGRPLERPPTAGRSPTGAPPAVRRPAPSREELEALLQAHQGDVAAIARRLGRQRTLVWRWVRKQGYDPALYRRRTGE